MDAAELVVKMQDFLEKYYAPQIAEAARTKQKTLVVDFQDLAKHDIAIADELLDKPEEVLKGGEMAIAQIEAPGETKGFSVRFHNIPPSSTYMIRDIRSTHLNKFLCVEGIVRNKGDVRPQVTAAKFECPSCGNTLNVLQLDTKFKEPFRCSCGRKGKFHLLSKELVDAQGLVLEEVPEQLEGGAQPKRVKVLLKNELVSPLTEKKTNPGSRIIATGIVKEVPQITKQGGQSTTFDIVFEANHVAPSQQDFSDIKITPEEELKIKELAQDPKLIKTMTTAIAPSIYGHEKIKESLVLQLVGGVRKTRDDGITTRGDIHILLVGDPGSGKCLAGTTKIPLQDGSIHAINTLPQSSAVNAIDRTGKIATQKSTHFWKRKSPSTLLRIRLASGRTLTVTKEHPLFTTEDAYVFAKPAHQYKPGDYLATARKLKYTGKVQRLPTIFHRSRSRNQQQLRIPRRLSTDMARLLGYLIGDGYVSPSATSGWISFTNSDHTLIRDYSRLIKKLFNGTTTIRSRTTSQEAYICSLALLNFLQSIDTGIVALSSSKQFPQAISRSPLPVLKQFIQALFECETHINQTKRQLEFTTISKNLAEDLQINLLKFGIVSLLKTKSKYAANTVRKRKMNAYEIIISGEQAEHYLATIGFISPNKKQQAHRLMRARNQTTSNTNIDIIPNLTTALRVLRTTLGLYQREMGLARPTYLHYERGDRNPSRNSLQKLITTLRKQYPSHQALMFLEQVAHADIFWDKIVEIKHVASTEPYVYDLQIDNHHNFVANGIIVHNSQMLKRISHVSPRGRFISGKGVSGAGLTASVVRDEFLGGWSLEAGALVLTNLGVCCIDELDKMSKDDTAAMHEALEGQSYHPDTEILLADGTRTTIRTFVDGLMKQTPDEIINGINCEFFFPDDKHILTTDFQTITPARVARVSRHPAPEFFYQITYSNGRRIVVTPEHPLFVYTNGHVTELPAGAATPGMTVPAPRTLPLPEQDIPLRQPQQTYHHSKPHTLPTNLTPPLARLLGYVITEGHSYQRSANRTYEIGVSNTDFSIITDVERLFGTLFATAIIRNVQPAARRTKATKNLATVRCNSHPIYDFFTDNFPEVMTKSPAKRAPPCLFKATLLCVREFLTAAFRGDGVLETDDFGYSTASRLLAEDYQDLLLRFSIPTIIREEHCGTHTYYKTIVTGRLTDKQRFVETIVCISDHRHSRIRSLLQRASNKRNQRDPVLPEHARAIHSALLDLRMEDGYLSGLLGKGHTPSTETLTPYVARIQQRLHKNGGTPQEIRNNNAVPVMELATRLHRSPAHIYNCEMETHHAHDQYLTVLRQAVADKQDHVNTLIRPVIDFLQSDIRLLRITRVDKIQNPGVPMVYDVTVMPHKSFISQGVVLHNTVTISKANIQATLRCETTVLAAANPKFGRFDPYDTIANQITLVPTLINRFDLIFPIKDVPDQKKDEKMARFILSLHKNSTVVSEGTLTTDFVRKYIAYARQHHSPKLTDAAIQEIEDYYIKMRASSSGGGVKSIPISARQLEALVRLSEASARLHLRNKVLAKDAKKAIEIVDYYLRQVAYDEKTGTIDIDRIATDVSAQTRNKIIIVKEIIAELEAKHGKAVPIDEINKLAVNKGVTESELDEVIQKLKRAGDLFEPRPGFVSRI
ncbi:hypothetical protein HY490_00560 [Candidatus Woesearchaeota archaeon]|nr:hypothetical protein [Candidatus Woesearchaeota archaeon]